MHEPRERTSHKMADSIQERLTNYAFDFHYDGLSPEVIHAAKVRVIDTLGVLIGGFFGDPCRIGRNLAAQVPSPNGATVIGTRMKTTPEMAAFVNATTARNAEMTDTYHWPGSSHGHPSDVIMPILAVAEHVRANGRDFVACVVLAYEIYLRLSNAFHNGGFDHTNFCVLGSAVAAGKLLGLSSGQLSHCISMAMVPNVILKQTRKGQLSMFKATASGQAGRAGVFAALLAREGMEGPQLPFEGKAGWCDHVALERFSLDSMGGAGTPFKILDTSIKLYPSAGFSIASILAAEKVAPLNSIKDIKQVTVEVYSKLKELGGTGELHWNPMSREAADHSTPYLVAATLMDGTITQNSFNDAHLWNPELRSLMKKIEVVENEEFTRAFERVPVEHRTRVTVLKVSGECMVGETGGDKGDLVEEKSDSHIIKKFRELTEAYLGDPRINFILDRLWQLENVKNVSDIPPAFNLD